MSERDSVRAFRAGVSVRRVFVWNIAMKETIRIAAGQGFWGDLPDGPVRQVEGGPIDYLMLDYLAEVTMSIMQKQKARDPNAGYARDFVPLMKQILPTCVEQDIKVVANAGGVNVEGCAAAVRDVARELGLAGKLKIGIVTGDDILDRVDDLLSRGVELRNMDTDEPLATVRNRIQSANAYLGAAPIVEALNHGAQIVITGRATDTGLTLGPMIHEFGWRSDEWDKLAAGTIAGHIIECGAQCSGGNCQYEWQSIPDLANVGFPIAEASADGTFVITKHEGTGGRVNIPSIKEQLVYEMGDPREYITPDCVADFTTIQLAGDGSDRVRVFGIKGRPATDSLKVSISYSAGYKAVGTLVYAWPDAYAKAKAGDKILRARLERLSLRFDQILTEYVGANATHGPLAAEPSPDLAEVQLRVGVRGNDRKAIERFTKEIAPLILTGPPAVTGFAGGRPKVEEIVAYWPALIPKSEIESRVNVIEV
ncbi:MAG TPA: acyclic terpene utilization AtuA family protein [Pyrinomonadaceae bacterium]|nr:acyclic terpene utilization AtuA family protein [Pyrinomonadaceae bacterium]